MRRTALITAASVLAAAITTVLTTAPTHAAEGASWQGAVTGDVVTPDTTLTVASDITAPIQITARAIAGDGSVTNTRTSTRTVTPGQSISAGWLMDGWGSAVAGGDWRLETRQCVVESGTCVWYPGQTIEVALDAPLDIYVHHLHWSAARGVWEPDFVMFSQPGDATVTVSDAGGQVSDPIVLGRVRLSPDVTIPGVDVNGDPLPDDRTYAVRFAETRESIVAPGLSYSGHLDISARAGDLGDWSLSGGSLVTVPDQAAQAVTATVTSNLDGRLTLEWWNTSESSPLMRRLYDADVRAGVPISADIVGDDDATDSQFTPVAPGVYRVVARLNDGDADRDNTFGAVAVVGNITVMDGHWATRTVTRTTRATATLTSVHRGQCLRARSPASRGWRGSLFLRTARCSPDPRVVAWTRHDSTVPTFRHGWQRVTLSAYGGAALGHPGSRATAEPFNEQPTTLRSRLGWHRIGTIRARDGLAGKRLEWYVSAPRGNAYDLKSFRLQYVVKDHPVPD